jgi:hypothetical protein
MSPPTASGPTKDRSRGGWDWSQLWTAVTALTALGALIFTGLSLQTSRQQNAIAEQGQVTDRYVKAVGQLGSDKTDVRLGGIYALERLAEDSPRDHDTVVQVLAAFIRDHAQPLLATSPPSTAGTSAAPGWAGRPADLQAAFTVLNRIETNPDKRAAIDLRRIVLRGRGLPGTDMHGGLCETLFEEVESDCRAE